MSPRVLVISIVLDMREVDCFVVNLQKNSFIALIVATFAIKYNADFDTTDT